MADDATPVGVADLVASPELLEALVALNNAHARELSWLEPERLMRLAAAAYSARVIGDAAAFLLTFDQDSDYDSSNFLWFRARYSRFVYVDRIVVAPAARGLGYARRLYADLFEQARRGRHEHVVCEVNEDPPNPASDVFHASLGFSKVGTATLADGKVVRYFERRLG